MVTLQALVFTEGSHSSRRVHKELCQRKPWHSWKDQTQWLTNSTVGKYAPLQTVNSQDREKLQLPKKSVTLKRNYDMLLQVSRGKLNTVNNRFKSKNFWIGACWEWVLNPGRLLKKRKKENQNKVTIPIHAKISPKIDLETLFSLFFDKPINGLQVSALTERSWETLHHTSSTPWRSIGHLW